MEEKIWNMLVEMKQRFEKKFDEIQNKIDDMNEKIEKRFDTLEEDDKNLHQEMNDLHEEIIEVRDQQLVFEHEYGTKIQAIFDAVTMELDKNLEKSVKIRKLDNRMDRCETNLFSHERRISSLELNQ